MYEDVTEIIECRVERRDADFALRRVNDLLKQGYRLLAIHERAEVIDEGRPFQESFTVYILANPAPRKGPMQGFEEYTGKEAE